MAFAENASFKHSDVICQSPLLSSLPDKLPMDKTDSDGFFSIVTKLVCRYSDSSYNTTVLSLIILATYPQELLSLYLLT